MEYKKMNGNLYIRIDKGEEVIETIKYICEKEKIYGGYFQGIGACDRVVLSTYIASENDFIDHTYTGMIEMISLMGNVSVDNDGKAFLHSHGVFSYLKDKAIRVTAGHLKEATIGYTGEIVLTPANDTIERKVDPKAGIEVWKLS